jgi:hypothetical protein
VGLLPPFVALELKVTACPEHILLMSALILMDGVINGFTVTPTVLEVTGLEVKQEAFDVSTHFTCSPFDKLLVV